MEFSICSSSPETQKSACIIVGIYERGKLSDAATALDKALDGLLSSLCQRGDISGEEGELLWVPHVTGIPAERLLLVGCGKTKTLSESSFRKITTAVAKALEKTAADEVYNTLTGLAVKGRDLSWQLVQTVLLMEDSRYRFDELKTGKKPKAAKLKHMALQVPQDADTIALEQQLARAMATADGVSLARDLANRPGNICTPRYLADQAKQLKKGNKRLTVEVLDENAMEELGMGALLAVARGSDEPPRLIVLNHQGGKKNDKPIVLVGKGITFDTGGISIKPAEAMDEMKFDMGGAAAVMGTMKAVAQLRLPINVVGIIAAAENMPDGKAVKPGDVITTMAGKTVEVLNTDAEGRLVLSDALTYAERFDPDVVVDMATLTGACIIALGHQTTAVLGNHRPLVQALLDAGQQACDRAWELPLWDEYQEQLKSNFADMGNIGGRAAGTITAACFLSRFAEKYRWAHLDIAGVAWKSGPQKGASGRPVPLLMQYLFNRAGA